MLEPEFRLADAIRQRALVPYRYYPILIELTEEEAEVYGRLSLKIGRAMAMRQDEENDLEEAKRRADERKQVVTQIRQKILSFGQNTIAQSNDAHILNSITKVQSTLDQFRQRLTLRKLNQLETTVTKCFLFLLHKSNLVHRIEIDAQTFQLQLYDHQGQQIPKHRLSAGEKQLLATAFLWGLAQISGRRLPIAIDTPLGRLDSSHRTNLLNRYFPTVSHQVILLSTDTEIGRSETEQLHQQNTIARQYLLHYDLGQQQTTIKVGYFWDETSWNPQSGASTSHKQLKTN